MSSQGTNGKSRISIPTTMKAILLDRPGPPEVLRYADTPTLVIGTHFAGPTAGRLVRDGDAYRLDL